MQKVGFAENPTICVPAIATEENIIAARTAFREKNAHFLTTVLEDRYPDFYLEEQGSDAPDFNDNDMKIIGSPVDFVGINLYPDRHVVADTGSERGYRILQHPASYPHMHAPWIKVSPEITYWAPRFL